MTRILLIAAMLLPVASAMATVTITADVNTVQHDIGGVAHKTVTIGYTGDVDVRAFALDINVDNGTNIGDNPPTGFLRGESITPNKGYGIFPGRFRDFIDPTTPDWGDENYMPLAPWAAPGAENTGLGWPKMVVELGTLYSGEPNKPDQASGTLFTFDINSEGLTDCNLTIAADALRGGIVGSDAAEIITANLPLTVPVTFQQGCLVPDCVGLALGRQACRDAILAAGLPIGVEVNVPGTGPPQAQRQVIAQNPAGGSTVACDTPVGFSAVSWPILVTSPIYANWQLRNRPQCWAYPRNCRGDGNGIKTGQYWVQSGDFNLYKSGANKTEAQLNLITNGSCADFNRTKTGQYWVQSGDFNIYKSYANKTETNVPLCGNVVNPSADVNFTYWCLPTSTTTCPAGQYCAPVGVCPNAP